jgi:hypothetical protein
MHFYSMYEDVYARILNYVIIAYRDINATGGF